MKRSFGIWQFFGFGFVSLAGTLLHFLYEWTGGSPVAAPVSGVNESTFEHMKLLFFPLFIYAIIEYVFWRELPEFWDIKLRGTLPGLILIPVLFYTYNGVIGKSPDFINIAIFFVSAAAVFLYETRCYNMGSVPRHRKWAFPALCILAVLFSLLTFFPPQIALFRDPVTGTYGIPK